MNEINEGLNQALIQAQPDTAHLAQFAGRVLAWLITDLNETPAGVSHAPAYTASRARALMRAAGTFDEPTWHDFQRLAETHEGMRVALFDLLEASSLAEDEEVQALAQVAAQSNPTDTPAIEWLSLAIAAFAWKREYPLYQLDPASPPGPLSPAGQILTDAAHFIRQQVQRSATDREKLSRQLAFQAGSANLEQMQSDAPIAPLPPHFRTPIPVRYPEYSRETVAVNSDELAGEPTPPTPVRGEPIVITEADLAGTPASQPAGQSTPQQPVRMPPITISREQIEQTTPAAPSPPSPLPPSAVVMPAPQRSTNPQARTSLTMSIRSMFRQEDLKSTKLRVVVQEYPDGPGLYGLQVKVTCRGIKSFVAGTTDREGNFVAELPVRISEGLTYDVDVDWPREMGAETERKSITLNADRTEFRLPFYRRLTES